MEGNLPTQPTLTLTATLTGAIAAGYALGGDNAVVDAAGEHPKGIACMDGVAGDAISYDVEGMTQGAAAAAITAEWTELSIAADGRLKVAVSGEFIFARSLSTTTAAGQNLQMLITREGVKA
ncbi:MAG: hypothetical protein ACFB0C_15650 [Leptolyngbyaceae cyanobacterium]